MQIAELQHSLVTERLRVELPPAEAANAVAAYFSKNRAFHAPFDPPRSPDSYAVAAWSDRLSFNRIQAETGTGARFFLFSRVETGPCLGHIALTRVARGASQSAHLSYALDEDVVGRGLMREALVAVLGFAFGTFRLHRVQASYLPTNVRSGRVLRHLGFAVEGYARDYLYIDGAWRDHVLTALYSPHPEPPAIRP